MSDCSVTAADLESHYQQAVFDRRLIELPSQGVDLIKHFYVPEALSPIAFESDVREWKLAIASIRKQTGCNDEAGALAMKREIEESSKGEKNLQHILKILGGRVMTRMSQSSRSCY